MVIIAHWTLATRAPLPARVYMFSRVQLVARVLAGAVKTRAGHYSPVSQVNCFFLKVES